MDSCGFFIDTVGKDPADNGEESPHEDDQEEILGAKAAAIEQKQRERAEKERGLESFLFGKSTEAVVIQNSDAESSSSESEVESDLEDEDLSEADSDEITETPSVNIESSNTAASTAVDPEPSQTSLPPDVFGSVLDLGKSTKRKRKAAWVDQEDSKVLVKDVVANYNKAKGKHGVKEISEEQYQKSLGRKFKSLVGEPAWANLDREVDEDSDEEFFRETTELQSKRCKENLSKGAIQIRKLKDLNYTSHKEGSIIGGLEFHPTSTVGLVAGNNGTTSLFQVDGKENPKIQTINFENFPIKTAKFSSSGTEFMVGSLQHPHFFVYDMMVGQMMKIPCKLNGETSERLNSGKFSVSPDGKLIALVGKCGLIHLMSGRTKELVHSFKMNSACLALAFSLDSCSLYSTGEEGEVYVWDLRTREPTHKFADEGSLCSSSIAANSRMLCVGSTSGVVNVYDRDQLSSNSPCPQPLRAVMNLTTEVTSLAIHPQDELLGLASMVKESAVKLVQLPSITAFRNFPGEGLNLGRINSVSFSPGGGYMGLGNNKGAALLYRIHHYPTY